jgi:glycosyltransferase involved in cell wall biosynthesis
MVILEAMACGIPVVTSEMAGGAEAVRASGVGALWNGEHVRSLVEAVEKTAATATEKSEEIGRRARAFVEEHHTWQSVGKRLLAAYRSVLEKSA